MKKLVLFSTAAVAAYTAQAAFVTTNATDGAILKGGSSTNVVQAASSISVKDAGSDGTIDNGGLRIGMLKLDLSGVTGTVYAASINLFQKEPDPYDFYVWTVDHDAPGQDWTEASATLDSVLSSGLFDPQTGLYKASDPNLNLIGVKHFAGDDGDSQYNWESFSSFKGNDLASWVNDAVADGSNTLTLVFGSSSGSSIGTFRGASHSDAPYLRFSYDPADEPALVENVFQIGGQGFHRNEGWNSAVPNATTNSATLTITDAADTNLQIQVMLKAVNPADVLTFNTTHVAVDSSARQTDVNTGRLNDDEQIEVTISYIDPNGSLLDIGMSGIGAIWGNNSSETTTVTDAVGGSYDIVAMDNDTFVQGTYGNTGLEQLSKSNTNAWKLTWSATGDDTTSSVGAFALTYLTGALDPAHGEVALNSMWSNSSGLELLDQSATHASATFTNTVDGTNRRFFQRASDGKFTSAPVQVSETVTVSFTAKIGSDKALNGADRVFRGSIWDEGVSENNGLSFRVDYGDVGGTTMELGKCSISGSGYVGNIGGTTNSALVPSGALVDQGDESDFVLRLTRTGLTTVDLSLTQDDVTLSKSYADFNFDSFDAIGFRINLDNENHLIITNLLVEITGAAGIDTNNFAYWAEDMGLTEGVNDGLYDDAEAGGGDGVNNLLEYALGGDPLVDDAASILPVESVDATYLNYDYSRRTDAAARGLTYDVDSTLNLVIGPMTNDTEEAGSVDVGGGFESVTNRVPTATEDTQFMGLEVGLSE